MNTNPYAPPTAEVADVDPLAGSDAEVRYAGFWIRVVAVLIDAILLSVITMPLLWAIYGIGHFEGEREGMIAGPADFLISWVAPAVASVFFWRRKQATPGKMVVSAKVVDARTGQTLSINQSVGRYFGYFLSGVPLGLGFLWIAFDARKQGWHDKIAGTVVVRGRKP